MKRTVGTRHADEHHAQDGAVTKTRVARLGPISFRRQVYHVIARTDTPPTGGLMHQRRTRRTYTICCFFVLSAVCVSSPTGRVRHRRTPGTQLTRTAGACAGHDVRSMITVRSASSSRDTLAGKPKLYQSSCRLLVQEPGEAHCGVGERSREIRRENRRRRRA